MPTGIGQCHPVTERSARSAGEEGWTHKSGPKSTRRKAERATADVSQMTDRMKPSRDAVTRPLVAGNQ